MKRAAVGAAGACVVLVGAVVGGIVAQAWTPRLTLNADPDVEQCRRAASSTTHPDVNMNDDMRFATWTGGALTVHWAASADVACPAPKFPFVEADAGKGFRFIQIIDVNTRGPDVDDANGGKTLVVTPWKFVDMSPSASGTNDKSAPFVNNLDGTFWDNPAWLDPPHDIVWTAHSYAVVVNDGAVDAVFGFSWGYTYGPGDKAGPHAVKPAALSADAWRADRALLQRAFTGWRFE